jgi:hypothetical protein
MKAILTAVALAIGLLSPAFAQSQSEHSAPDDQHAINGTHAAPAPLIGAGLSSLAVGIGYGVYWLARRRRRVIG